MDREQAYEISAKLYQDASPGDVGVPLKLFPQEPGALQGSYPYESAVQELRLLTTDRCPQRKLECIGESPSLILTWVPITCFNFQFVCYDAFCFFELAQQQLKLGKRQTVGPLASSIPLYWFIFYILYMYNYCGR